MIDCSKVNKDRFSFVPAVEVTGYEPKTEEEKVHGEEWKARLKAKLAKQK